GLDRRDGVARRDLAVAVELHQALLREAVQVRHRGDDPLAPEPADELLADALDVHRRLDPVDQGLEAPRLALRVRAAVHDLALGLHDLGPAKRTRFGHAKALRTLLPGQDGTDHLRDHVARPLD